MREEQYPTKRMRVMVPPILQMLDEQFDPAVTTMPTIPVSPAANFNRINRHAAAFYADTTELLPRNADTIFNIILSRLHHPGEDAPGAAPLADLRQLWDGLVASHESSSSLAHFEHRDPFLEGMAQAMLTVAMTEAIIDCEEGLAEFEAELKRMKKWAPYHQLLRVLGFLYFVCFVWYHTIR
ncbi:hypothetical protein BT63DRAFT_449859 [Microthyrium microscopicum]|uniref:Uncharacterized protein n=1 Tax=Microthyrium microscopicum TaxID=703497 RepID=A0A6A6USV5_9PEZI|nr:hypothetical protein BT63DRAFT_449859 [Microthyrium microscopicum]